MGDEIDDVTRAEDDLLRAADRWEAAALKTIAARTAVATAGAGPEAVEDDEQARLSFAAEVTPVKVLAAVRLVREVLGDDGPAVPAYV